jgi:hypothetical protein
MQTFLTLSAIALLIVVVIAMAIILLRKSPELPDVPQLSYYDDAYIMLHIQVSNCMTEKECTKALSDLLAFNRKFKDMPCVREDVAHLAGLLEEKELLNIS